MSNLGTILHKTKFNPQRFSGLKLWLSGADFNSLTLSYNNLVETASGTIGTNNITASATVAAKLFVGNKIKVGATDIYTIASVSTVTITTVETLTATYAALTTLAVGQISQWNDKSGQGNHATQGTGTAQPTYVASILNGKSVLTFDGGDTLALPSALYSIANGPNTAFIVSKRNTETGSGYLIIDMGNSGSGRFYMGFSNVSGNCTFLSRSSDANTVVDTGNTNTNYQILTSFRSGTTQSLSVNGDTATTNTSGQNASDVNSAYVGSRNGSSGFLIGGIAEILIYNRALTNPEISRINRFLSTKWAITIL